jgi:pimeloyl-ACP methyl ester carboxylesterase
MWRLMEVLGLETFHLVGCSLGSRIAARMSLEKPERLSSLTVDAPIIGISAGGGVSLNNAFTVVDEDSDQAREWAMLHGPDWREVVAFYAKARGTPGLQDYLTVREELESISVPTLICRGDHDDPVHPLGDSFIWHSKTPRSELLVFPGATQSSVMLEGADDFLKAFRAFTGRLATPHPA